MLSISNRILVLQRELFKDYKFDFKFASLFHYLIIDLSERVKERATDILDSD